ncbi:MAG TPA: imidazolonepropionase [Acidimicrobiales bacterium]|nr:imidazolonepropionase [Acidimicrobiales bacterium]
MSGAGRILLGGGSPASGASRLGSPGAGAPGFGPPAGGAPGGASGFGPPPAGAPGGSLAVTGIGLLVTNAPDLGEGPLGVVRDAALVIEDGVVAWVGPAAEIPEAAGAGCLDAGGRAVVPGFVDSHTHLVFAGERAEEFAARMAGRHYEAGGIATTVAATRAASDETLAANVARLALEALESGTTTIETKSGYGLSVEDEARSLRAARGVTAETTFLGAHVVPAEWAGDREGYVGLVCGAMLAACRPLARYVDVFCDRGAFDGDEARAVLEAGQAAGLLAKVHGNQLEAGPGVRVAVEAGAISVDHCSHLSSADVECLAGSATVATLLPAAELSTRSPFPDALRLLAAGVQIALASDCNPGTSYTTSMPLAIALAVGGMGMTVEEALRAATLGGAAALRRDDVGHLAPGAAGDVLVLEAPSYLHLAYRPGVPLTAAVLRAGRRADRHGRLLA